MRLHVITVITVVIRVKPIVSIYRLSHPVRPICHKLIRRGISSSTPMRVRSWGGVKAEFR